ncbi:MAG: hypothetical protein K0S56_1755 [Microvirga sp.]|jgi:hypothetical protein|nr:hypothetical protein [Microvirga sp.]
MAFVQRLAAQIFLNHLSLEVDAVGAVLCNGPSSFESGIPVNS